MYVAHHEERSDTHRINGLALQVGELLKPSDYIFDVSDDDLEAVATQLSPKPHTIFSMRALTCRC